MSILGARFDAGRRKLRVAAVLTLVIAMPVFVAEPANANHAGFYTQGYDWYESVNTGYCGYANTNYTRSVQIMLRTSGLYSGQIDGTWGPQTNQGAVAYQGQNGLYADGCVGHATWTNLQGKRFLQYTLSYGSRWHWRNGGAAFVTYDWDRDAGCWFFQSVDMLWWPVGTMTTRTCNFATYNP